jgi:LysM repeat protein
MISPHFTPIRWTAIVGTLSLFACSTLTAAESSTTYVVRKGDTLGCIARDHGCTVQTLKTTNKLTSDLIVTGRTLRLPQPAGTGLSEKQIEKKDEKDSKKDDRPSAKLTATIPINTKQPSAVINRDVLSKADDHNTSVVIDISRQRAFLLVGGRVAIETPVSTGKEGHPTPLGVFKISERMESGKVSNLYDAAMPYWMRLGSLAIGMHIGVVPGAPASHGCIRLPRQIAPLMFAHTTTGTTVRVLERWTPPSKGLLAAK